MDETDVERADLTRADILHLSGITLALSESASRATILAAEHARAVGARVSFDINHRSTLWSAEDAIPLYRALLAMSDIVFAGDDEAALALDRDLSVGPQRLAREVARFGPSEVIVKLGDRGAGSLVDGVWRQRDAVPARVVDTVGAGDAFVGAYLAGILLGFNPSERLDLARRNGAAACTHPGDWEGAGTLEELQLASTDTTLR